MSGDSGRESSDLWSDCTSLWKTKELSDACHFEYPNLQKILLQEEGLEASWNGKYWCVDLKQYGWKHTIEDVKKFAGENL